MENYAVRFMALIVTIMLKNYVQYAQLEIISGEKKTLIILILVLLGRSTHKATLSKKMLLLNWDVKIAGRGRLPT